MTGSALRRSSRLIVDITDAGEDLARDQRSDAVQLGQGAAGAGDGGFDVLGGLGDAAIELAHLADQIHRQRAQRLGGGVTGPYAAQEFSDVIGRSSCARHRREPGW